jgi:hypothetical protein
MSSIFPDPSAPTDDTILWRYLPHGNFKRLLDPRPALLDWGILLESDPCPASWNGFGSLWFAGPDLYRMKDEESGGDPREGTFPTFNLDDDEVCRLGAERMGLKPEDAQERKRKYVEWNPEWIRGQKQLMTRLCGVTCWHHNTTESFWMWCGYVGNGPGVVVKTTMKALEESIYNQPLIVHQRATASSEVQASTRFKQAIDIAWPRFAHTKYIDFDEVFEPDDGYIGVLRLKGGGFRHENEVRGIARSPNLEDRSNERLASLSETHVSGYLTKSPGFNLSVDLETLLGEVRVSPEADDSCLEDVRERLAAKGLSSILVRHSELERRGGDTSEGTP